MKVGFVGSGNMAGGLARGWSAARNEPGAPDQMLFADADHARAGALAEEVGGEAFEGNLALADHSDLVVLAVSRTSWMRSRRISFRQARPSCRSLRVRR